MKKVIFLLFIFLTLNNYAQELRGTWIARNTLTSKESIAAAMDSLAKNNFNVVYINVWSRGYPLWQSDLFFQETGYRIDPEATYTNRDILAEAIAEGHRVGLHVEAWFEYGFVGGWTGNLPANSKGPIFTNHPDWVAVTQTGVEKDGSNFYWMVHTRPDVQNFLIGMAAEICRKYDVDGIEMDRIRYSSLEYGYDDYTKILYKSEHNDSLPPTNFNDAGWLRWRADKLNDFMARFYDSVKSINPHVNVSNAPSLYSSSGYSAYTSFAQDWAWWVNNNKIDNVQVQSYVSNAGAFGNIINFISTFINDKSKIFPAFAIMPNSTPLANSELINFVTTTRNAGYGGNSIWYYTDLIPKFGVFKSSVYSDKVVPPYSDVNWREVKDIVKVSDTANVKRTGNWVASTLSGYSGNSIMISGSQGEVDYFFDVPAEGKYEVYAYIISASNRTDSAYFRIYDTTGNFIEKIINQTISANRRWYKLGDINLKAGRQKVFNVSNRFAGASEYLSADAGMILLNRGYSPNVLTGIEPEEKKNETGIEGFEIKSYPNPFNNQTKIVFNLNTLNSYKINVHNILGERIFELDKEPMQSGWQEIFLDFGKYQLSSGVYFVSINQNEKRETLKILLTK